MDKFSLFLRIEGLRTYFDTDRGVVRAVDGVNLEIYSGETLGVVGESGCGKSMTALSIIRLFPSPPGRIAGGKIWFKGIELTSLSKKEIRAIRGKQIGMIFQEPMTSLNPVYSVGEQIVEALRIHRNLSKKLAKEEAIRILAEVGIASPEKRFYEYPHQLSGGMRQRVMIAIALSCNPSLLIADEPTTALDVTIQAQILELMNDLKRKLGTAIMFITHDLGVIAQMAQRVVVMYAGKIVEQASAID
ncbi:MAG: ABC transporter ATP-binding protein, partial [Candidatus Bathyarchaeia archaeon]